MKKTTLLLLAALIFSQITFGGKWDVMLSDLGQKENPTQNAIAKDEDKIRESDNLLSDGAKLLFKEVKTKLTIREQNHIYTQLGFHLSKDKNSFTDGTSEEDAFGALVLPTDMNKDGIEEIFVSYGNTYTSGMAGADIVLFIKNEKGVYEKNLGFPGLIPDALSSSNKGYPDLVIGGPGFEFPVWRWNGKQYDLHRRIKNEELKTIKTKSIEAMSTQYQNAMK